MAPTDEKSSNHGSTEQMTETKPQPKPVVETLVQDKPPTAEPKPKARKLVEPWAALLTLKEKIKNKTDDPVENTINQFLNQNLEETELDYILKFKKSDEYKTNIDWLGKGLGLQGLGLQEK